MVTDLIERIRAALQQDGVTPGGVASRAGLHRNTLYGWDQQSWNPTAETLRKLEPVVAIIEAGEWRQEDATKAAA